MMMPPHMAVGLPSLISLAIGFLAMGIALLGARLRARPDAKQAVGKRDPRSILWIMLQGLGFFIASFGPIEVDIVPMSMTAKIEGAIVLVLMLAAASLFDWSSRTMGRNWALVARTRGDASLVTTGPFAYVRNPIYVALGLMMIAMGIGFGHPGNLLLALPVYALGTWLRVASEERVLRAAFGAAYDAYAGRVKRFVPGII